MNEENDAHGDNNAAQIPTTNAGEVAFLVDKETKCGGSLGNYKISEHILLNQVDALLTRKIIKLEKIARITISFSEFMLLQMDLQFH